jgi:hypothetical protein
LWDTARWESTDCGSSALVGHVSLSLFFCLAKPDIEIWSIFLFYFLFQGRANKYESKDMVARFSMML